MEKEQNCSKFSSRCHQNVQGSAKNIQAVNSFVEVVKNNKKNMLRGKKMHLVHKHALEEGEVFEFPNGISLVFFGEVSLNSII